MTLFKNIVLFCAVMMLRLVGMTLPAHAETYRHFYELITDGEALFENCDSGEISNVIADVEQELNAEYENSTFGIVCIPKWYVIDDPEKRTVLLVPFSLGDPVTSVDIRATINEQIRFPSCGDVVKTCREADGFEKTAYEYSDVNVFPNFTREAYAYDSFLDELNSPGLENTIRIQILKLIQANLTPEDYDRNTWVDGKEGPGTRKVLEKFFNDLKADYPDAVPRDVLLTNLFQTLVRHNDAQSYPLTTPTNTYTESTLAVEPESVEISETTTIETRNEETVVEENSDIVDETAEATESVKLDLSPANATTETEQLELQIVDLRKQVEELQGLYSDLKESHEREMTAVLEDHEKEISSWSAIMQQPISEVWDARIFQRSFNTTGKLPDGKSVALKVLERSFSERDCTLSIDQPLETQFVKHIEQNKCFVLSFEEYDEDTNSSRAYDENSNTLTIPVLEKQSDLILSITSESLDDFDEVDTNSCWVGLKLLDEANRDNGTTTELWMEVTDVDGRMKAKLTDFDTVDAKELSWRDRKLQLVDLTPEGQTSSCMVTNTKAFDVISGDREPNDKAPTARIDRLGNVVLKNLPLVKKQAPELHIFLDTLVGPEGDENYGFNGAINSKEERETQALYFEGFLKGVQGFLAKRKDIEKVTIHQTVLEGKNRELQELQTFTRATMVDDTSLITDEFISEYISNFNAGIPGEFDNKKRKLARLLKSNGNSLFISFGSSGLTDDKVCQRKIPRQDYTENSVIFDVIPSFTVDQLIEADELETVSRGFAFKCSNQDRIIPLKPLKSKAMEEVIEIVETKLSDWRY